jgi:hypothetical protein
MASRKELEEAVRTGHRVRIPGRVGTIRHVKFLPPDPEPTDDNPSPTPVEGVIAYTPDGRLTHEGMRMALAEGGSVLYKGEVIDNLDALPPPEEVDAGDDERLAALAGDLDAQIAALETRRARVKAMGGKAKGKGEQPAAWQPGAQDQDTQVLSAPEPPPAPPEEEEGRKRRGHKREE